MEFFNHCTQELYNEAARLCQELDGVERWKDQILCEVVDDLEKGWMERHATGWESQPFNVGEVKGIVDKVVALDEMMQQH